MRIFSYSPEPAKDHMIDAYPVRIGKGRVYFTLSLRGGQEESSLSLLVSSRSAD